MGLTASNKGGNFELVPAGPKVGRCFWVIDLGTQHNEMYDKDVNQVLIGWEFPNDCMEDGRPFSLTNFYTVSLSEKANLRRDLEAWRGRAFTDAELEGFNLKNILGVTAYINVVHGKNKKGEDRAYLGSIMPLVDKECPPVVNETIFFNWEDEFDATVFDKIPEGIQGIIKKSFEYKEKVEGGGSVTPRDEPPPAADASEAGDIPPF